MISNRRKLFLWTVRGLMSLATSLTGLLTLFLVGYVLIRGIPNVSWELLSTSPSYPSDRIGILPDLLNTLYIVVMTVIIVLPLGVGAAIYLTEYATNKHLVNIIEFATETLSGIPSIIYGLVGMLFFVEFCFPIAQHQSLKFCLRQKTRLVLRPLDQHPGNALPTAQHIFWF